MLPQHTIIRSKRYMAIVIILLILVVVFLVTSKTNKKIENVSQETVEIKDEPKYYPDYQDGIASYYDYTLGHEDQRCTKDREPCYSQLNLTCASRDYPKGTMLHVATADDFIICRVNDWVENPNVIIDLSSYAFQKLAPLKLGLIKVTVQEVKE